MKAKSLGTIYQPQISGELTPQKKDIMSLEGSKETSNRTYHYQQIKSHPKEELKSSEDAVKKKLCD